MKNKVIINPDDINITLPILLLSFDAKFIESLGKVSASSFCHLKAFNDDCLFFYIAIISF